LIISLSGLFYACARDYVTGKRTLSLVSESQEIAIGKESDPAVIAEFGLYEDREIAAMVNEIGQKLAKVSHRPNLPFTFRVVDSPVVNAFALPGGYVYFTRGILAHFNSEAELAGVMGHEIGHVTARHGAEQQTQAQLAGLGLGLARFFPKVFAVIAIWRKPALAFFFLNTAVTMNPNPTSSASNIPPRRDMTPCTCRDFSAPLPALVKAAEAPFLLFFRPTPIRQTVSNA
jgi:hypothetical protein